jgi:hypothetical protein
MPPDKNRPFGSSKRALFCCCSAACGGAIPPGATDAGGSQGVPANYRQLVARNISARKMDLVKLVCAEISSPGEWQGPFGLGGKRPIVCARLTIDGPIIRQTYNLGYTFQNGEIAEVFDPDSVNPAAGGAFGAALKSAATCGKLSYSPFPELSKRS